SPEVVPVPGGTRVEMHRQLSNPVLESAKRWLWNAFGGNAEKSTGRTYCMQVSHCKLARVVVLNSERFGRGMTFDEYVAFMATPENLRREGSGGAPRVDRSDFFRKARDTARLTPDQTAALEW